jgi:hypothetical protein
MFYYVWTIGMLFLGIFGLWIIMLYKEDTQEQFRNYPVVTKIPNILPPNPNMRDAEPRHRKTVEGYMDKVRR